MTALDLFGWVFVISACVAIAGLVGFLLFGLFLYARDMWREFR